MNLEGLTLKLVTDTLTSELLHSKIYKVYMPTNNSVLLCLKQARGTTTLLADMNGASPALYIPERMPENPEMPPTFCMLLRKHLEEGRITKIYQSDLDRIITLEIDMLGAKSQIITKKLIFELAGKNSNIILTQDDIIIDSIKHVSAAQSSYRTVLPQKPYVAPPPQAGLNILQASPAEIVQTANALPAANFLKAFIASTIGIGKATATELLLQADILPSEVRLEPASCKELEAVLQNLQADLAENGAEHKVYALIGKTNQVKTIYPFLPQNVEDGARVQEFANINQAINFACSLKPIQLPQHEQLQKLVANEIAKLQKKELALASDLEHAEDAEQQRMLADTIMANIYQLQKGQSEAELYNIYDGELVKVKLSPLLTPTENAQAYYKRYNKFKRAQGEIKLQQEATQEMLAYLASIEASLLTASTKNEIEEIKQELISIGLIKIVGKKKSAIANQKSQPLRIRLNDYTELYIGKNNKQNDYVTFSIANGNDLWLHTKDIPGSHVVIKTTNPEPSEEEILLAAQFAAYYSKARNGSNVPVDCVQRKYVKKPSGSKPGFVIFTNQSTYYVTAEEEELKKYME